MGVIPKFLYTSIIISKHMFILIFNLLSFYYNVSPTLKNYLFTKNTQIIIIILNSHE